MSSYDIEAPHSWPISSLSAVPDRAGADRLAEMLEELIPGPWRVDSTSMTRYLMQLRRVDSRSAAFPVDAKEEAVVRTRAGGFTIVFSEGLVSRRSGSLGSYVDFVTAHELAHTCFYDADSERPQRSLPISPAEETFCNRVARRLLARDIPTLSGPLQPQALVELSKKYRLTLGAVSFVASMDDPDVTVVLVDRQAPLPRLVWCAGKRITGLPDYVRSTLGGRPGRRLYGVHAAAYADVFDDRATLFTLYRRAVA